MKCAVTGCASLTPGSRGYCNSHYKAFRQSGTLAKLPKPAPRTCSVEGCNGTYNAIGLCKRHYMRFLLKGDVEAEKPFRFRWRDIAKWLEDHLEYDGDECLIWPFTRGRTGYGQLTTRAVRAMRPELQDARSKQYITASRGMALLVLGDPPGPKRVAAHSCGNGHLGCVHPKHIRWATYTENYSDKALHGARTSSADNPFANQAQVNAVRQLWPTMSITDIAAAFRVSPETIEAILKP